MAAHHGAAQFPSLLTSAGDLYGASSFRMCEAHEFALDVDALDREELALEQMVQALVARKAPVPIGVKFHRPTPQSASTVRQGRHGTGPDDHDVDLEVGNSIGDRDERGDDEDDDVEEEEGDDMDEDELDEGDDAFPLDGRDSDDALESEEDDPFARDDYSLDDMDMDVEGEDVEEEDDQRQRDTW